MSNIPNSLNDDALLGDDSQDPADAFLVDPRDTVMSVAESLGMEDNDEMDIGDSAREDLFMSDTEADADALASAGMGTDEDYGCYGGGGED